jgi:hypothetical protein
MARSHSPPDANYPPHHARSFDDFSSAIALNAQPSPTPLHAACSLRVCNSGDDDTPGISTVTVTMADGTSVDIVVPVNWSETIRGAFLSIDSVTGDGADGTTVIAFWGDFGT